MAVDVRSLNGNVAWFVVCRCSFQCFLVIGVMVDICLSDRFDRFDCISPFFLLDWFITVGITVSVRLSYGARRLIV